MLERAFKNIAPEFNGFPLVRKILFVLFGIFSCLMVFSGMSMVERGGIENTLTWVIWGIQCCICVTYFYLYGHIVKSIYLSLVFAFLFWILLSWLVTWVTPRTTPFVLGFFSAVLFFVLSVGKSERNIFFIGMYIGALGFLFYFIGVYWDNIIQFNMESNSDRIGSYFNNINEMAPYFVFIVFMSFYFVVRKGFWWVAIFAILSFYCLVLTGSISNLLSLCVAAFIGILAILKKRQRPKFICFFLVLVGLLFVLIQFPQFSYFKTRIEGIVVSLFTGGSSGDNSSSYRLVLVIDAIRLTLERPLFGYGYYGTWNNSVTGAYSHNNFTEIAGVYGVPAMVIFECIVLLPIFIFLFKKHHRFQVSYSPIIFLCIYIFIFQMFLGTVYHKMNWLIFAWVYAQLLPAATAKNRSLFRRKVLV